VDPEKENKRYSNQLGAKKESNDELAKSIEVILGDHKNHLVIDRRTSMFRSYWGQCCSKTIHDLVKLQQQLMGNAALERYFHIFILVYHPQHGYDF
jgi:hypothetical protein